MVSIIRGVYHASGKCLRDRSFKFSDTTGKWRRDRSFEFSDTTGSKGGMKSVDQYTGSPL